MMTTEQITDMPTVKVRINEFNFVLWQEVSRSGVYEDVPTPKGGTRKVWRGDELWCSPAQAEEWTSGTDPARPLVTIVGNRSIAEAKAAEAKTAAAKEG